MSATRRGSRVPGQVPATPATPRVWVAELPGVFGYGCRGYGWTETEAMLACERAYKSLRASYGTSTPFDHNWEQFGGHCAEVTIGKGYVEGNVGRDSDTGRDLGY